MTGTDILLDEAKDRLRASRAEAVRLNERIALLEAALARWTTADGGGGLHLGGCASAQGDACTCGLDAAQALLKE